MPGPPPRAPTARAGTPADPLALVGRLLPRLRVREVLPGISEISATTAATDTLGVPTSAWQVDDALVDTLFAHVRPLVLDRLRDRRIRWIALTHHHEDHMGNAGPLAERHGCPVYLRRAEERDTEGVVALAPYRRLYWGFPGPWTAEEMPPVLQTSRRRLRVVPTPGHSRTQVALLDESTGVAFTGDLYVSSGAAAVLTYEDPWQIAASCRTLAACGPRRLLGGHGLDLPDPVPRLLAKADRVEAAATRAVEARDAGLDEDEILARVFPGVWLKNLAFDLLTEGQFTWRAFVRNALAGHDARHDPGR